MLLPQLRVERGLNRLESVGGQLLGDSHAGGCGGHREGQKILKVIVAVRHISRSRKR